MAKQIDIRAVLNTTQVDGSLNELKTKFSELEDVLGSNLLSPEETQQVLVRMGQIKGEITDMETQIDSLASTNAFDELVTLTTPLVGAITAAGSATQLLGVENEKLNEVIQRTTQLTIGLSSLREIANAKAIKNIFIRRSAQLKAYAVDKLTFDMTKKQTTANVVQAASTTKVTKSVRLATKAQLLWNKAIKSNPIMIIVTAIALLAGGIYALVQSQKESNKLSEEEIELQEERKDKLDELNKSYEDNSMRIQEMVDNYENLTGIIGDQEKAQRDLERTIKDGIDEINKRYDEQIEKLNEYNKTQLSNLEIEQSLLNTRIQSMESVNGANGEMLEFLKDLKDQYEENQKVIDKYYKLQEQRIKETSLFEANKRKEAARKIVKSSQDQFNKRKELIGKIIDEINDEFNVIKENIDEVENNYNQFIKSVDDLEFEIMPESQAKEIQKVKRDMEKLKESYADIVGENDKLIKGNKESISDIDDLMVKNEEHIDFLKESNNEIQETIKSNSLLAEVTQNVIDKNLDTEGKRLEALTFVYNNTQRIQDLQLQYNDNQKEIYDIEKKLKELNSEKLKLQEDINESEELNLKLKENQKLEASLARKLEKELQKIKEKYAEQRLENERKNEEKLIEAKLRIQELYHKSVQNENDKAYKIDLEESEKREKNILDKRIELLEQYYGERRKILKEKIKEEQKLIEEGKSIERETTDEDLEKLDAELKDKTDTLTDTFNNRWASVKQNVRDSFAELGYMLGDSLGELFSRSISNKFEALNRRLQEQVENSKQSLNNLRDQDLISEEQYNRRMEKIEEDAYKKEIKLKREQARAEKRNALFQIAVDTAAGVAKSWGQGGGLFGAPLASIVAIQGALQAALVASEPLPEFKEGGLVEGLSHSKGGVPVELEGQEYIINKEVTSQPGMIPMLDAINNSRRPSPSYSPDNNNNEFIKEMKDTILSITSIPVVNVESDYTRVQRKVNSIENRSKF